MERLATINDVAKIAGVSRQTVSRAINNKGEISLDTREQVLKVVQHLGYRPNRMAQGLVTQHTLTIGIIIPDISNPFFPEFARGVQDFAHQEEYNVFLCNTDGNPDEEVKALYSLAAQGVDGVILFTYQGSDDILKEFADKYHPVVVLNRYVEHPNIAVIMVNNYHGAKLAVEHLIERGHTNIAMLAGPDTSPSKVRQVKGFCDALTEHGLPVVAKWIISSLPLPTLTQGYQSAHQLLSKNPQITAIFAYNDLLAIGAIRACNELGYRVPTDCAIVGFDDIQLASMVTPSLTTIYVNKYTLGEQAMARLLNMINNPDSVSPSIYVDVELVVREST